MSGVFGAVSVDRAQDLESLGSAMGRSMEHHDWIQSRFYCDQEALIGSITNGIFNHEPQPVWNAGRTAALVMAGEIYEADGQDVTGRSVEQTALSMYEKYGNDFAARVEGAFIIAIYDLTRRKLIITNDRWGMYPLYYAFDGSRLVFAPEVNVLLQAPGARRVIDRAALAQYTRWQFLIGSRTFFEDISLLPSAAVMVFDFDAGRLDCREYWDFSQIEKLEGKVSFDEAVEETSRLLENAVQRLLRGDRRAGIYLTSGLDSRVVLGYMLDEFQPVTVTFGRPESRDVDNARRMARKLGLINHFFAFTDGKWVQENAPYHLNLTEGFHSWIHMHGISILPQVKELMDVNLSGYGGAELNWDSDALLKAPDETAFNSILFQHLLYSTTWPSVTESEYRSLFSQSAVKEMTELVWESFLQESQRFSHLPFDLRSAAFSRANPDRRMYMYYTVFNRSHIEQRFPFCDYRYLDFMFGLPVAYKRNRRLRKAVIARKMPRLASIPHDKDGLPVTESSLRLLAARAVQKAKDAVNRKIAPVFRDYPILHSDYETWLRTDLREWGQDLLLGEKTLGRGIFNPEGLRSLWERQLLGLEPDMIGKVAPLMSWEMLMRRFVDGSRQ